MILGTQPRVRPMADLLELTTELDNLAAPAWPDPRDHRDRGHFLTPRLYPTAPFEPWEPISAYAERLCPTRSPGSPCSS
jgi:hypothetical protein